ncbi:DNA-directed DNA polymerase II small subunit [Candidatus Woesearchaeota archaeon]|nr:DNA-directed DNA polymerase II small subunit [Candidatus Woesearchaeota archaeon]
MDLNNLKKEIVSLLIDKKILISKTVIEKIKSLDDEKTIKQIIENISDNLDSVTDVNIIDFLNLELNKNNLENDIDKNSFIEANVEIIQNHKEDNAKKKELMDFVYYFRNRYKSISNILKGKSELEETIAITRINSRKESMKKVALIGMVYEIETSKNGHLIVTLEDLTGKIKLIISKNNQDIFEKAKDLVYDEVIGVIGSSSYDEKYNSTVIFANEIIHPDISLTKELKKSPDESYAMFLSDIHFGSNYFLPDNFNKFINFLNGDCDEKYKDKIDKIKYLFIAGDLVDGIGIYPSQIDELTIPDIFKQYEEAAKYISRIPERIKIIICPGNHDALRLAEPQPALPKSLCPDLYKLSNVYMVSNPGLVRIHQTENFPGFDVLLYHGYSFDYYVSNVDSIRNEGGYHRADLLMKFFLQRRHLCPTHASTPYIPNSFQDPLVISKIPDFFVTGHIHYSKVANYNNITLICGSCWQRATSFQLKVGHDPEPHRVPLVNLKTRATEVLLFD